MKAIKLVTLLLIACAGCRQSKQVKEEMLCYFKVEKPYSLIQFSDSSYGILYYYFMDWFKCDPNSGHDFSIVRQEALHFNDSCQAKSALVTFLKQQGKLEFRILPK